MPKFPEHSQTKRFFEASKLNLTTPGRPITDGRFEGFENRHDLADFLVSKGLIEKGSNSVNLTEDDANAILIRAERAYSELEDDLALCYAYLDRMAAIKPNNFPVLESIETGTIKELLRNRGVAASEEDICMLLTYGRSGGWKNGQSGIIDSWLDFRSNTGADDQVAGVIDRNDNVVTVGKGSDSEATLLKRATEDN